MSTKIQLEQEEKKNIQVLSSIESSEIQKTFEEAKDFRTIWEKITAPIDSIISKTAQIIEKDPIMKVSTELEKMNGEVKEVYDEIIDNDWKLMKLFKSLPLIWNLAKNLDNKMDEAKFNMKWLEGKIATIFSWFDQAYESVNLSIDLQKDFTNWLEANLWKILAYKEFIDKKLIEFNEKIEKTNEEQEKAKLSMFIRNVEYFQWNLIVLISNLEMARTRLLMKLDAANKLSLAMNSSRPIFKTLLSTAIIETSSQKALDASIKAMDIMWKTIDKMSSELTDKAIETSKKSEEISSKPVLSTNVFIENVTKLKNHFDEIETFRKKIKEEAEQERKLFWEAKIKLDNIKVLSSESYDELAQEINTK